MKNIEMLKELARVEPLHDRIAELAERIIRETSNRDICEVINLMFDVEQDRVSVSFRDGCRGGWCVGHANIPITWFKEGFDYKAAYESMLSDAEKESKRRMAEVAERWEAEKKAADEWKSKMEYEAYLKLKQKFEEEGAE